MSKVCTRCEEQLDEVCFTKDKYTPDGLNRRCRECIRWANRDRYKKWIARSKLPHVSKHGPDSKQSDYRKSVKLYSRYGITLKDKQEMIKAQGGVCAICAIELTAPHLDHDHITNKIRGVLCTLCNTGLGAFKDNPALLIKASEYLS